MPTLRSQLTRFIDAIKFGKREPNFNVPIERAELLSEIKLEDLKNIYKTVRGPSFQKYPKIFQNVPRCP